jgi:hypothetical protein
MSRMRSMHCGMRAWYRQDLAQAGMVFAVSWPASPIDSGLAIRRKLHARPVLCGQWRVQGEWLFPRYVP